MKRRMMMESAMNLEVDLSSLGMDERPESPEEFEEAGLCVGSVLEGPDVRLPGPWTGSNIGWGQLSQRPTVAA